jgi:hypothetical protein
MTSTDKLLEDIKKKIVARNAQKRNWYYKQKLLTKEKNKGKIIINHQNNFRSSVNPTTSIGEITMNENSIENINLNEQIQDNHIQNKDYNFKNQENDLENEEEYDYDENYDFEKEDNNEELESSDEEFNDLENLFYDSENENGKDYDNYNELNKKFKDTFLYPGSKITNYEFILMFVWLCQKLRLAKVNRELLANWIGNLLPFPNNVISYRRMIKLLNLTKKNRRVINVCSSCYKEKDEKEECICNKDIACDRMNLKIAKFDIKDQLSKLIVKYDAEIKHFKGIISDCLLDNIIYLNNLTFKILTASDQKYTLFNDELDKITIVLFFDGASLKKTGSSGNIWAVYGMLMDLGPRLRSHFENIIQIFLIGI